MNPAGALPAEGRLLAQSVTASTFQLVRGLRDAADPERLRFLMAERHRLLDELARYMNTDRHVGSLTALEAAVAESDRTLEVLLA
jgi:hypothetical protein